jgi:hypothetical protein
MEEDGVRKDLKLVPLLTSKLREFQMTPFIPRKGAAFDLKS